MPKKLSDAAKAERARLRKLKSEQDDFTCKVTKWLNSEDEGAIRGMFEKLVDPPDYSIFYHKIDGEKVKIILLRTTPNDFVIVTSDERDVCDIEVLR